MVPTSSPAAPEGTSPATAPASAPSAPVAPAAPSPGSKLTAAQIIAKATPEERRAIALGKPIAAPAGTPAAPPAAATPSPAPAAAETTPAAPAPATNGQPAAAAPTETQPAQPTAEGTAPGEEPAANPDRFRFKNEEDQAIALIAKTKGISLRQASKLYEEQNGAPPAATTPAATETPAVDPDLKAYDDQAKALSDKLTKLTADRKKAREDLENDKADELSDAIAEAKSDLKLLENAKQGHIRNREAEKQRAAIETINASRDRAYEKYPVLGDPKNPHHLALIGYINTVQADPAKAGFFQNPAWPEKIAEEYATKFGVTAAGTAPATQPAAAAPAPNPAAVMAQPAARPPAVKQPQQVTQPTGAKMLTGADGGRPSAPSAMTPDSIKEKMRTDPEFRREAARVVGAKFGGK